MVDFSGKCTSDFKFICPPCLTTPVTLKGIDEDMCFAKGSAWLKSLRNAPSDMEGAQDPVFLEIVSFAD
jgi:hypothetical protein